MRSDIFFINSAEIMSKLSGEKFNNFSPKCIINNTDNGELLSLIYEVKFNNTLIHSIENFSPKSII